MTDQTGPKRSPFQIQRDRQRIADWYCQGLTQADIAERLNKGRDFTLSQQTISNDLCAIQKEWLASALRDFDEARAQELGKIDRLEREYWRGWERSCEDAETVRKEGSAGGVEKVVKTEKGQAGDPRFLAGVERCIERRCKLLGLDAPIKQDITSGGKPLFDMDAWKAERQARLEDVGQLDDET
jgi:hypothetical protein